MPKLWDVYLHRMAVQDKYKFGQGDRNAAAITEALEILRNNPEHPDRGVTEDGDFEVSINGFLFTYEIELGDDNRGIVRVFSIE